MKFNKMFSLMVVAIIAITLVAVPMVFAADYYKAAAGGGSAPNLYRLNILSKASTTSGAGPNTYKFGVPMSRLTCQTVYSGPTFSTLVLQIDASNDGTNWSPIVVSSQTVSTVVPNIVSLSSGTIFNQIRPNVITMTTSSLPNTPGAYGTLLTTNCDVLQ